MFRTRQLWQVTAAGAAVGLLTVGAAAQLDTETQQQDQPAQERGIQNQDQGQDQAQQPAWPAEPEGRAGAQAQGQLQIGTVDLMQIAEAYKEAEESGGEGQQRDRQDDLFGPAGADDPAVDRQEGRDSGAGEGDRQREFGEEPNREQREFGDDTEQEPLGADSELQEPQAEREDPLGRRAGQDRLGGGQDEATVDQEMIDSISEMAQEVANEQGVDLVVLEVLHGGQDEGGLAAPAGAGARGGEQAQFQTVDLTQQVIQRIREGDGQQDPLGIERDAEMEDRQAPDLESDEQADPLGDDASEEQDDELTW